MQNGYKNDPNIDPKGNKNEPKFILYPVLGNASSPGPERVIAAGNWDPLRAEGTQACWAKCRGVVSFQSVLLCEEAAVLQVSCLKGKFERSFGSFWGY